MTRKILVQIPKNQLDLFLTKQSYEQLQQFGDVIWNPHDRQFTEDELIEQIKDVDTVVTSWKSIAISDKVLDAAPKLKLIAHMAGSVKPIIPNIDLFDRGVRVLNSNYAIAVSVSEAVLALILALGHKILRTDHVMKNGALWKTPELHLETYELRGRTVGLIGLGMVAREVIKLLQPFGVNILGYDPFLPEEVAKKLNVTLKPLHEVISEAEIISMHAPKIPETYQMIGKKELEMIQDGALLINTARGDLIDQVALINELKKNRFSAGLDVFDVEPLPLDSELRHMENVIARPHLAGVNPGSRLRIGTLMLEELKRFYNNEPLLFEVRKEQMANMT